MRSPPLCVILAQAGVEVVVGELLRCAFLVAEYGARLGMLLEVLHIIRRMATFHRGEVARTTVLALPDEILPERLGQFGREHIPAGGFRREGHLLMGIGGGHDDGLRTGLLVARDLQVGARFG